MKLIDFHTHIYPENIAGLATKTVGEFYDIEPVALGTAENLLKTQRQAGVSLSVLLPVAVKPQHVSHINDFTSRCAAEHDEFIGFGTVHAGQEDVISEVERFPSLGLKGVKIHPDHQFFNIDDERLFPLYDYMQDRIPLIVHTGDYRYDYSHPRRLKRVMEMFPHLTCIAAHFGGWSMTETAAEILPPFENCYIDISSSFQYISIEQGEEYIKKYSVDRVLFGSDFPMGSAVIERENLMKLRLSDDDREKIAYKNAEKLLDIKL